MQNEKCNVDKKIKGEKMLDKKIIKNIIKNNREDGGSL